MKIPRELNIYKMLDSIKAAKLSIFSANSEKKEDEEDAVELVVILGHPTF